MTDRYAMANVSENSTTSSSPPIESPSPLPEDSVVNQEILSSWAILILISLLFITLLTSYYLQRRKIRFVHETVVSIFLGIIVGLAIRLSDSKAIQDMITFDHHYFFNLLLPPIILNSGYDLKRKNFFRNFGTILTFAFAGTLISTVVIGILLRLVVMTGLHHMEFSLLDCMIFGAVLSSTDPVTIIAIFHQLKVDPKLFAIIFGESILNDSVAIVLFSTLSQFHGKEMTLFSLFHGVGSFLFVFFGSLMIGLILALICSLMLKHSYLHQYPSLESCIISILAYSSYLLSNAIQLSGIVSLLFCGITLKHYAYDNMSIRSRRTTKYMFRVLSQLSENFIFIYLGVTLFTKGDDLYLPGFIFFTLLIVLVARYASTIPIAQAINYVSRKMHPERNEEIIPRNHQLMLWWAGLRGAVAFALSFDVPGPSASAVRTTTLVVCVVIGVGVRPYSVRSRQEIDIDDGSDDDLGKDDETDSSEDDGEDWDDNDEEDGLPSAALRRQQRSMEQHPQLDSVEEGRDNLPNNRRRGSQPGVARTSNESPVGFRNDDDWDGFSGRDIDMTHWFISFDTQWLKPLFTRSRYSSISPGLASGRRRMDGLGSESRELAGTDRISLLRSIGGGGRPSTPPQGSRRSFDSPLSRARSPSAPLSSSRGGRSSSPVAGSAQASKRGFGRAVGTGGAASGDTLPTNSNATSPISNLWWNNSVNVQDSEEEESRRRVGRGGVAMRPPSAPGSGFASFAAGLGSAFSSMSVLGASSLVAGAEVEAQESFIGVDGKAWTRPSRVGGPSAQKRGGPAAMELSGVGG
ncbi:Sodium/hydrogen exchanger family-domain-containing protein [Zopfochytrium polystomum]|nr:Sodium/hydrogen exchanger family-domain-containing protein [Zopfochytrium polystomum]